MSRGRRRGRAPSPCPGFARSPRGRRRRRAQPPRGSRWSSAWASSSVSVQAKKAGLAKLERRQGGSADRVEQGAFAIGAVDGPGNLQDGADALLPETENTARDSSGGEEE